MDPENRVGDKGQKYAEKFASDFVKPEKKQNQQQKMGWIMFCGTKFS